MATLTDCDTADEIRGLNQPFKAVSKIKTEKPAIIKVGAKVTIEKIKTSLLCNSCPAFLSFISLRRITKCFETKKVKVDKTIQINNNINEEANK